MSIDRHIVHDPLVYRNGHTTFPFRIVRRHSSARNSVRFAYEFVRMSSVGAHSRSSCWNGSEGFRPEGAIIWPSIGPICCMRGPRTCDMPAAPEAPPAGAPPAAPPPPLLAGPIIWVSIGPMACIMSASPPPPGAAAGFPCAAREGGTPPWSASNVAPARPPARLLSC